MSQGIFGLVDFGAGLGDAAAIAERVGRFLRQAPEGGAYSFALGHGYLLGMRRVAIEPWQQNRLAQRSDFAGAVAIHGEYHNYVALRQEIELENPGCNGDLDLALLLYRKKGLDFARRLNGLFAFGIVDEQDKTCILLSDRFGMAHQLYWTVTRGRLCFATHLKLLLSLADIRRNVDPEALNLFLKYSYVPSPWSMFKGVRKLPPGHRLVYRNGTPELGEYVGFRVPPNPAMDIAEATAKYKGLLCKAISRRMAERGGNALLLSGGLDSSANVALATQCTTEPLHTISVGFEDPGVDERPYARLVATRFHTHHHEYTITGNEVEELPRLVWHLEEPYFEFGLFLSYVALSSARKYVGTVIGGEGADQLFGTGGFVGGRPAAAYYLLGASGLMRPARLFRRMLAGSYFSEHDNQAFKLRMFCNRATDLNEWFYYGYDQHELALLHKRAGEALVPTLFQDISVHGKAFAEVFRETVLMQDVRHYINENLMVKSGRIANMLDLALRESYLDADVADFLLSLEHQFRRSGGVLHHLLGRSKSKVLHRSMSASLLPMEIVGKPKQGGFVPVMIFLRDAGLRQKIYASLLHSDAIREHFRPEYLRYLFESYEVAHRQPVRWPNFRNSKANRILFLLTFDIWHHYFVANSPLSVEPPSLSDWLLQSTSSAPLRNSAAAGAAL